MIAMIGRWFGRRYDSSIQDNTEGDNMNTKPTQNKILATGRIVGRDENYCKANTYYIHKAVDKWIDDHAKGNKQLILNYLLARGIISMMEKDDMAIIDDMNESLNEMGL